MSEVLKLNPANCRNCYKCIRHCPVKSIAVTEDKANIVGNECVLCGRCFAICPQGAKQLADGIAGAKALLAAGGPVFAGVAPSFAANYGGAGIGAMDTALRALGFAGAGETAIGAHIVKTEYERVLREGGGCVITSCCHAVNLLIQKHYPEALQYLAAVKSPMQAHAEFIKRENPGAKVVFIGPCVAKKDEAEYYGGIVDAALTFEELDAWLAESGVSIGRERDADEDSRARFFPVAGGILKTMAPNINGYRYIAVDGMENCAELLREAREDGLERCFIELNACAGGCVGGPGMSKRRRPAADYAAIADYAGERDFDVPQPDAAALAKNMTWIQIRNRNPGEAAVNDILRKMGKFGENDMLNCGSCGYETCREKALAVYHGKANLRMCLPYLLAKAENFSDVILQNTPNAIFVLNDKLEVQQINRAALELMRIPSESVIIGDNIVRVLSPEVFEEVLDTGESVSARQIYLTEYGRHVEQSVFWDTDTRMAVCVMRDVTGETVTREKRQERHRKTAEVADGVIANQMRIVQEIAYLLGETAAETKIALTKLKESVADE